MRIGRSHPTRKQPTNGPRSTCASPSFKPLRNKEISGENKADKPSQRRPDAVNGQVPYGKARPARVSAWAFWIPLRRPRWAKN